MENDSATRRLPLTRSQIEVLIALEENEPATARLIDRVRGVQGKSSRDMARALIRLGLVTEEKLEPRVPLTEDEKYGEMPMDTHFGRLPYVYRLTVRGLLVAQYLRLAILAFHEPATAWLSAPSPDESRVNVTNGAERQRQL